MLTSKMTVPAPKIKHRNYEKLLLCGPGSCELWPSVAEALVRPVSSAFNELFNVLDDIKIGLKYLFQTKSTLVLAISGSGHAGMESIICNLVGPNETLLVVTRGTCDERAYHTAIRYGINAVKLTVPFNTRFNFKQIEEYLKELRPAALFITHGDCSTGCVHNLVGLGDICHKYGTLLLVDTVVSIGGEPFYMDEWGVDAVYTVAQTGLSGPAGIAPIAFSPLAEQKIYNRKHEPPFYFDIKLLAQQWNCHGISQVYHHTLSPPLIWALRCCLEEISKITLPELWRRHAETAAHFYRRLEEFGFQLLVTRPEDRLVTITTIVLPHGYDYALIVKYLRERFRIIILDGLGPTIGNALRIGIMGVNATIEIADIIALALRDTLRALTKASL